MADIWEIILSACVGFSAICVAVGWLIKIVKGVKKPSKDIHEMLDNDNKRINKLEDEMDYVKKALTILIRDDQVILEHLRTENATGKMAEREDKISEFLLERE